jgi:major type 1 subunit fimbrin (pilin)
VKIINKGIIVAAVLGTSAFIASAAQASDGTITINGEVTAQTCTITGTSGADVTVTLPRVQTTALPAGASAGRTAFALKLSNCTAAVAPATGKVFAFFEQGATVDTTTGNLINQTAGGSNVEVQFLNADGTIIDMSKPVDAPNAQGATNVTIAADNTATLTYAAQYKAGTANATAGLVGTSVMYSLHYN